MWYEFLPKLLNMSITGGIIIVLVLLARVLLRRAPKVFSYALWAVVLFRLLCPVSLSSAFSVFNIMETPISSSGSIEYIPENIVHTENSTVALPLPGISEAINNTLPQGNEQLSADPLELPVSVATYLWAFVAIALLGYSIVKLVLLKRKLVVAMPLPDSSQSNIYLADHITTPFVIGLFSPKIYLPSTLDEKERRYIIQHEQYHIRRLDHVVKILAFLALCIHWFNPLVWVAFVISGNDMEMSCDEAVMKRMGSDVRADYSQSLLSLATGHRIISGSPLAFGEGDTKGRIKNVLNYKKPIVWVSVLSVIAVLILAVCFISNPTQKLQVVEITDTSELTVMEVAWYEENSQTMGATVLQTETGYLFLYRGQADLYGYYTATAKLKSTTLQIDVKSNDAVSEEYISGTLLARIEVDHSKVENVSMNFDGGNLTLETVESGELLPEQPAMIRFYNVLFVLSTDQLDIDPSTLHEVGKVEEVVPPREIPESNGQSNRNIVGATLYENDGKSLIVEIENEYKLFVLTDEYDLYKQSNTTPSTENASFIQNYFTTAKEELSSYPADLTSEQAADAGMIVFGLKSDSNLDELKTFFEMVSQSGTVETTIAQATVEGDMILTRLMYTSGKYYVVEDSSRDAWRGTDNEGYANYANYEYTVLNQIDDTSGNIYLVLSNIQLASYEEMRSFEENHPDESRWIATYPAERNQIADELNDFVGDDYARIEGTENESGSTRQFFIRGNDLAEFQMWMKQANYSATWFSDGESPDQSDGVHSYSFIPVGGRNNAPFALYELSSTEYYVNWNNHWYSLYSDTEIPITK